MKNNQLTPTILADLKRQLEKKKGQLETQLSSFATKDPNLKDDWDTKYPRVPEGNIEEAADEVEEYSNKITVEFNLENQLKDVNTALARVQEDSYGVCEKCGKPISLERLQASPEARTCESCK